MCKQNSIDVKCTITNNGKELKAAEDIIDYIKKIEKKSISYSSCKMTIDTNSGEKKLDVKPNEILEPGENNTYCIFGSDDKIIYVGKSLKINKRLNQHLVKCSKSTRSKIANVSELLGKKCSEGKDLEIKYCSFQVSPSNYYGLIEGMLIKYFKEKKTEYENNWNIRRD